MGEDRDRSGAADSRGELPHEPDEFDSLVLDEAFIAAGIPEASLPRYQRWIPPGTAQDPESQGRSRRPERSGAADRSVDADNWPPRSNHTHRQRRTTAVLLAAAAVLVLGVVLTGILHLRTGLRGTAGTGPASSGFDVGAQAIRQQIADLPPTTGGTCFDAQTSSATSILVGPCSAPHRYELVGTVLADGQDDEYPSAGYWAGPIDQQCAHDLQVLTGKAPVNWPSGLRVGSLPPTPSDWAAGDRTVYCIADSTHLTSGGLGKLNSSAVVPTA